MHGGIILDHADKWQSHPTKCNWLSSQFGLLLLILSEPNCRTSGKNHRDGNGRKVEASTQVAVWSKCHSLTQLRLWRPTKRLCLRYTDCLKDNINGRHHSSLTTSDWLCLPDGTGLVLRQELDQLCLAWLSVLLAIWVSLKQYALRKVRLLTFIPHLFSVFTKPPVYFTIANAVPQRESKPQSTYCIQELILCAF